MSTAAGLTYEREGSGEPLLLIPGLGGELGVWEPVVPALAARHEVIAVDPPGFGASPPLAGGTEPTATALAGALVPFLDELGIDRAHVAGSSLGAWVALELALLGRALSVIGVAPAGLWDEPLKQHNEGPARAIGRRLMPLAPLLMRSRLVRRFFFRWTLAHPERLDPAAAVRMARNYLNGPAYVAADIAMRRTRFAAEDELTVPVTLIWCEHDRQVRPPKRELPWAKVVTLPGCGHLPMWDDPELTASTILAATAGEPARASRAGM